MAQTSTAESVIDTALFASKGHVKHSRNNPPSAEHTALAVQGRSSEAESTASDKASQSTLHFTITTLGLDL